MPWIDLPAGHQAAPGPRASLREPRRWYEFRNATEDEAELLLFDEVGGWFGVYADEFVEQLNAITASRLTVRVNSPGGSVFQGVAIANALRAHPATVTVRVEGLAASIASVIALAGDRLIMAPNSMFMIHDASGGCWGQASDMEKMAEILDKISDNLADAYAAKAGGTRADWRALMLAETWYTADEAVEAGLADELMVPPKPDEGPDDATTRMAAAWDLSVFRYAGRAAAPPPSPPESNPGEQATTDQASAPTSPRIPAAAAPLVPAETSPPEPAPVPTAGVAAIRADVDRRPAVDPESAAPPAPDPWADLIVRLLKPPAPPSADELLAHLREAK
jgi:ATP-dependent protease ClpP protease subunit